MATNRIDILKQMVTQDPNNSFARYGLAMEYVKAGEYESAVQDFQILIRNDPDYVAAYFHAGQALEKLGRIDQARESYEQGIEASTRKGDLHTRAEIQGALDLLPV
jgi:Tfp pilus assembly protein PilF